MPSALTISRFRIPREELRTCEHLFGHVPDSALGVAGFLSSSVWRGVDDAEEFLRLTIFESFETMEAFYDGILKSDKLVETIKEFGMVPDVTQMSVDAFKQFDPRKIKSSEYLSFSLRAMDPGYGDAWVEKLGNNLDEISLLPGYEGAIIATDVEVDERVAGFAFWQTEASFRRSVPDNPSYQIDLYSLYR